MLVKGTNEMFVKQLQDLLIAEMAEQSRWTPAIPLWHPRNEDPDPPQDPPKDPANPAGPPPADPAKTPPTFPNDPAASAEVAKAYEKLRTAEEQVKDLKPKAAKADSLLQENEQLKAENATLKGQQKESAAGTVIASKAHSLNFHRPDRAMQALRAYTDVDPLTLDDETKVEKALRDLAAQEQHLVGQVPPSGGPVHPASQNEGGNAAVNRAIRQAAGR